MPSDQLIREHKHLRWLGTLLHDPNLWHLNRRSVSGAFSLGLFMAFVPVPFQMVLSAIGAIPLRVNLPISVALVWITNPITIPPIFYSCYLLGCWVLGQPPALHGFELSSEWLAHELNIIWKPFLLGCFIAGTISSILGYVSVRLLWRWYMVRQWRHRRASQLREATKP